MNAQDIAAIGYTQSAQPLRTPRATEYEVFARVTRDLKEALADTPSNVSRLAAAIHRNRNLWTILATDLADKGNQLPNPLKAQLLALSEFVRLHSSEVLNKQSKGDILVEINASIMKGLSQEVPQ